MMNNVNTKQVYEFLKSFSEPVAGVALQLFQILADNLGELGFWIDAGDKMITFGTSKNMKGEICYLKPLKDSVNLGFFHGSSLSDPKGLLQGNGKKLRHIKFKKIETTNLEDIISLIKSAKQIHQLLNA